jgi:hypothetical protein
MFTLSFACFAEAPAERAESMAEQAGITGGLIVHVGCGVGTLTAVVATKPQSTSC